MLSIVYVGFAVVFALLFGYQLGKIFSGQALRKLADSLSGLKKEFAIQLQQRNAELDDCREQIAVLQKSSKESPETQEELRKLQMDYQSLEHQYMIVCEERKKDERIAKMELQKLQIELRTQEAIVCSLESTSRFHESQLKNLEETKEKEMMDVLAMTKVEAIDHFQAQKDALKTDINRWKESQQRIPEQIKQKKDMQKNMDSQSLDQEIAILEKELQTIADVNTMTVKRIDQIQRYISVLEEALL